MNELLRVAGIARRYGATIALDGVDIAVRAGEVHALIGENGAGKSTLMGVLAGAVRPDAGEMHLAGVHYDPHTTLDARRHGVALIHQELSLCPHLTVAENVLLGGEMSRNGVIGCKIWAINISSSSRSRPELRHIASNFHLF